jgi:hypothetical protein
MHRCLAILHRVKAVSVGCLFLNAFPLLPANLLHPFKVIRFGFHSSGVHGLLRIFLNYFQSLWENDHCFYAEGVATVSVHLTFIAVVMDTQID